VVTLALAVVLMVVLAKFLRLVVARLSSFFRGGPVTVRRLP
jgi:hypothetical protein